MREFLQAAVGLLVGIWAGASVAEEITAAQISQLDNEVQEVKAEVLDVATELIRLEEKLIYSEAARLTVFLVQDQGKAGAMVALKLKIDGKEAASHVYAFGEAEALRRGGAQRVYMGSIKPGQHAIEVTVAGRAADNNDHWHTANYRFFKRAGMKTIEITVVGLESGDPVISFRD